MIINQPAKTKMTKKKKGIKINEYPLLPRSFLLFQFFECACPPSFESLELLFLEGPIIWDSGVLLDLVLVLSSELLRFLGLFSLVLLHLPDDLVLLLQWHSLALTLCIKSIQIQITYTKLSHIFCR